MKYFFFCSLLVSTFLFGCTSSHPEGSSQNSATIGGTIENPASETVNFTVDGKEINVPLKGNSFTFSLDTEESRVVMFNIGDLYQQVFIAPGKDVRITVEKDSTKPAAPKRAIAFSGDLTTENDFLAHTLDSLKLPAFRDLYNQEEEAFIQSLGDHRTRVEEALDQISKKGNLEPGFRKLMDAQLTYEIANAYHSYENYYGYLTGKTDYKPSERLEGKKKAAMIDNPDAVGAPTYRNYVFSVVQQEAWNNVKEDEDIQNKPELFIQAMVDVMDEKIRSRPVRDHVFYSIMNYAMYDGLQKEEEAIYDRFLAEEQKATYLEQINELKNDWDKLEAGKPAPVFAYPDIDGKVISLEDLKEKVVYVDVWATWCGPCLAEQPDLEKLEAKFEGNPDVAFVGVSIDEDKEAWERMVRKKEMKGYQLHAREAWKASIVKDYKIGGIPRFIMIDGDGKIINASAPRPSSGEVEGLINENLEPKPKEALMMK